MFGLAGLIAVCDVVAAGAAAEVALVERFLAEPLAVVTRVGLGETRATHARHGSLSLKKT